MSSICPRSGRDCYKEQELPLLLEVSKMMNESSDISLALTDVMKLLSVYLTARRVMLTVLDRNSSRIILEAGYGLPNANQPVTYDVGEGIIGEVVEKGVPIFVPKINEDSRFVNKLKSSLLTTDRKDISFTCVPIKLQDKTVGTISIDRLYSKNSDYRHDIHVLTIVGSLVAGAVRARQDGIEEMQRLRQDKEKLETQIKNRHFKPENLIGNSGSMQEVYRLIQMVSKTTATVLIRGESGVGKELVADAIHHHSARTGKPFIKVNCAALPENLIESELFGHEKGSFTGATGLKKGRFELANGGTIFLDEIGDLPMPIQVKLLRTLQQRTFERVGGTQTLTTDVRIVAATNRDLEESIRDNTFREDLFYRINVFPMYLPALRERVADIPLLIDHFIEKANRIHGTNVLRISQEALDMLMIYKWPGNIRELENCIERSAIMAGDGVIRSHNLPPTLQTALSSGTEMRGTLETLVGNLEKQLIIDMLTKSNGNMVQAARLLDITERMMGVRIKKYDIDPKKYKLKE